MCFHIDLALPQPSAIPCSSAKRVPSSSRIHAVTGAAACFWSLQSFDAECATGSSQPEAVFIEGKKAAM